ncbi:hypothetical protein BYT27DRAFT_7207056 [Phlegmacium glaucopus]|nr:hypothetical protein BYT27DRAFT_7207056 [Phlegmacium glaucopus]
MSPSRKPLPSFMLVLTSGHHSLPLLPTTLQFDSYEPPAMLPTAPDSLMETIDLRDDALEYACDEDTDARTVFEAESPATFDRGAERSSNHSIKNLLLFLRKFIPYKRNFANNAPLVALKPCLN